MTSIAFDTLKFARTLRDRAKMPPEQAEGLADALLEAIQNDIPTRADLKGVETSIDSLRAATKSDIEGIKASIETLRTATKSDIESVKASIEALRAAGKSDIESLKSDVEGVKSDIRGVRSDIEGIKAGIEALRTGTKADIDAARVSSREAELRLETRIESTKSDVIKWVAGLIGFQTLAIIGAVIALARILKP